MRKFPKINSNQLQIDKSDAEFPNKIITCMKKLHQSFDVDIRSTQEKEKKFCRKGISPSPKTSSNKSDKSLSKFWVKNLRVSASGKSLETTIMLANQKNEEANLLRREGVRNKNELSGWGDY